MAGFDLGSQAFLLLRPRTPRIAARRESWELADPLLRQFAAELRDLETVGADPR